MGTQMRVLGVISGLLILLPQANPSPRLVSPYISRFSPLKRATYDPHISTSQNYPTPLTPTLPAASALAGDSPTRRRRPLGRGRGGARPRRTTGGKKGGEGGWIGREGWGISDGTVTEGGKDLPEPQFWSSSVPVKCYVFIDGTWLYYSLVKRLIPDTYGPDWHHRLCIDFDEFSRRLNDHLQARILNTGRAVDIEKVLVFGSLSNTDESRSEFFKHLQAQNFQMIMFESRKYQEKRVDIALAVELLHYATEPHGFDIAITVVGDEDFVPALQRTRLKGKRVCVASVKNSCSNNLKKAQVSDFPYIWLDDILPSLLTETEKSFGAAETHKEERLSLILEVMVAFIQNNHGRVSSRDMGRVLKQHDMLKDVHLHFGGLRRLCAECKDVLGFINDPDDDHIFQIYLNDQINDDPSDLSDLSDLSDSADSADSSAYHNQLDRQDVQIAGFDLSKLTLELSEESFIDSESEEDIDQGADDIFATIDLDLPEPSGTQEIGTQGIESEGFGRQREVGRQEEEAEADLDDFLDDIGEESVMFDDDDLVEEMSLELVEVAARNFGKITQPQNQPISQQAQDEDDRFELLEQDFGSSLTSSSTIDLQHIEQGT
ncbi:hypothetical protein AAMO2058_001459000 [Amorphochlora amoebiformis]